MSVGSPSKSCPRCNAVLPFQAPFCGNCGYQFAAAQGAPVGSTFGAAPYGQSAPGGWPQGQPGYPPQGQPGYYPPQGQPGFGFPAAPAPVPPKKGGAGKVIVLILILVVLVGGGAGAWFFYLNPSRCSGPLFNRHGLQSNIPLPAGCNFNSTRTETNTENGITATVSQWVWTVDSPNNPTTLSQFYKDKLPGGGWTHVKDNTDQQGNKGVIGCQEDQILLVGVGQKDVLKDDNGKVIATVTAPSGGSVLEIDLVKTNSKELRLFVCGG